MAVTMTQTQTQPEEHTRRAMRGGEVARMLGISVQWLSLLGNTGKIAYRIDEVSGWRVYDRAEIERYRAARGNKRARKGA